jgi:hypothetical protein
MSASPPVLRGAAQLIIEQRFSNTSPLRELREWRAPSQSVGADEIATKGRRLTDDFRLSLH